MLLAIPKDFLTSRSPSSAHASHTPAFNQTQNGRQFTPLQAVRIPSAARDRSNCCSAMCPAPTAYTAKELLATDPRVFADWLETHRPRSVLPGQKARILEALPSKGEITSLDDAGRHKLAALKQLLQATDRESVYEVKVTDVAYARIVIFERSIILISKSAFMLLDAEELQALAAHEMAHETSLSTTRAPSEPETIVVSRISNCSATPLRS